MIIIKTEFRVRNIYTQQPKVWFLQAEARFHIRKISDYTTKYYHVVAAPDQERSGPIRHILM